MVWIFNIYKISQAKETNEALVYQSFVVKMQVHTVVYQKVIKFISQLWPLFNLLLMQIWKCFKVENIVLVPL